MNARRAIFTAVVASLALVFSACGDDETTVTETTVQEAAPTSTAMPTMTTSTTTTATSSTTSTATGSTTTSPAANCDSNNGQIYSQVTGGCVDQRSGQNPCPAGEVPMADQAVCVKDDQ